MAATSKKTVAGSPSNGGRGMKTQLRDLLGTKLSDVIPRRGLCSFFKARSSRMIWGCPEVPHTP
ncbi:hypothetical protein J6590_091519 [Homalodisca vitripennis]|nr:hypothetical protein J6590_091519 [Homalodisca vitripennis]